MLKAHCSACIPKPHHHLHPCPQQHSELQKRVLTNLQVVLATNLHHNLFCALFSLALDDNVMCVCQSLSRVRLFVTPWTAACQSPLSREFSRQKYWSELPFPSPGDLQTQGLNTGSFYNIKNFSYFESEGVSCSVMSNSFDTMDCSLPGSSVHGIL